MVLAAEEAVTADPLVSAKGSGLWRYILIRFFLIFPTVIILVTVVFFLTRITGDPITAALGGRLPPDQLAERVHAAGYDRPLLLQFGSATLELAIYALIVAFIVGIPFGLLAARLRDRWPDAFLRIGAILFYATPVFVAILLKLVFAAWLEWLPVAGRASTRTELLLQTVPNPTGIYLIDAIRLGNPDAVGDVLWHAVLPGLALGLLTAGVFLRLVRTNVIGTLGAQYVTSARSRGVNEYRLLTKHAYRPALIPIVTVMGLQIALLLSGAVLTEKSFEWKGIGFMLSEYIKARDFVAVQGIIIMIAIIVAFTNFLVDIIAAVIDPRVRY